MLRSLAYYDDANKHKLGPMERQAWMTTRVVSTSKTIRLLFISGYNSFQRLTAAGIATEQAAPRQPTLRLRSTSRHCLRADDVIFRAISMNRTD